VQTPDFPEPFTGKIVRVDASGQIEDFVTGLMVPTGLTIGPDGALYVSNWSAVPGSAGQVLRITIPD
jgi:sugar lactone lactonase YvrE